MLARALGATPWGIEARPVEVEIDVRLGLPQFHLVGLPDAAVRESRERVRSAIKNCGFELPARAVVVNLAPADLRKEGNHLDLAIALALLAASEQIPTGYLDGRLLSGELGLDGALRPVRGALALAALAQRTCARELLVPWENGVEAAALEGVPVIGAPTLADAIQHVLGAHPIEPTASPGPRLEKPHDAKRHRSGDLAEVRGQAVAKRALEIAAAGGHNMLFVGPPGCGKTMLASRLPGILPPLSRSEAIAITKIHSLAGNSPGTGLVTERPFRSPHASVSTAGLIGGGSYVRPGEVSLAHGGVLFLDELPEFGRGALEALRQPLEDGEVTIVRARSRFTFPARFCLVAAMNPCRCGHLGDPRHECRCTSGDVERYRNRVSGPLLDRVDLQVELQPVGYEELNGADAEATATVAARTLGARLIQEERLRAERRNTNATLTPRLLKRYTPLDSSSHRLLRTAYERIGLSARGLDRVRKVALTIADLEGSDRVTETHLAEAIQYRALDLVSSP